MILLVLVLVVGYGVWRLRRRGKRHLVAGLVSERPAFYTSPPSRRVGSLKDGHL